MSSMAKAMGGFFLVLLFAIQWVYFVVWDALRGRSPGKAAFGLRVVTTSGRPIGWRAAALRNLLRAADALPTAYIVGVTAMALNFAAMIMLPLAEATAIGFSVPIFSTVLAAMVLGEPTGKWRWGAVGAGFLGVLLIVQPGSGEVPLLGASVALVAALLTASVTIVIRRLGKTERASTTVFWFAASSLVPLGAMMIWFAGSHDPQTWAILGVMALAGGLAQLTLTGALRLAPVALVMPMDYTSLLWATLLGAWIFAELPTPWIWIGAPIIIMSGLVIVWREHRLMRRAALAAATASPN
jgi:drug/metabolite transporter (DMT)-like permease